MSGLIDLRSGATPTAVVTGCAGFIGSHLSERLIADGVRVIGIDAFRPYYERAAKVDNLATLNNEPNFELLELDLATADLAPLMASAGTVFHIAAQPGVRRSFGDGFTGYALDNMVATQRVFEAAGEAGCPRVSGRRPRRSTATRRLPVRGDLHPDRTPVALRGHEAGLRGPRRGLPDAGASVVGLRYFTVYGPRQRPDMAIRRLCEALVGEGGTFPLFGDGNQTRDITYVGDVVDATVLAGRALDPDPIYNVGGGHEVSSQPRDRYAGGSWPVAASRSSGSRRRRVMSDAPGPTAPPPAGRSAGTRTSRWPKGSQTSWNGCKPPAPRGWRERRRW